MITEYMQLNSKADARTWASQWPLDDGQIEALTDWIWDNKPAIGCCYVDHPLHDLSVEAFWALFD